ncbi:MFS transporter [Stappia sp.]|uniref:MFS transporter n=1 Tax=Stappia sp. TaxID=1870903 RepID=UPI0032D8DB11
MADPAAHSRVAWSELLTREHAPALALVCLGVWLHAADGLVVATMLPAIVAEIGGGAMVAWSVALYEIGSIVAGATGGFLALRYGLRLPMTLAGALFALGCLVSALAPTMPVLLAGRLLQGLGGGGLVALSFVAVSLLFPPRLMARAMAAISALWGVSSFLGPLIGGVFVEAATWRAGFVFFAVQALALALWIGLAARLGARPPATGVSSPMPVARLTVLAAGIVSIAWAGIDIDPVATPAFVAAGGVLLIVFLVLDRGAGADRLLPPGPFGLVTAHGSALAMVLAMSAATIAITAYGPLLVVAIHGVSAIVAGYLVACSAVGWTVFAILVSGSDPRHDPRYIAVGMAMVVASIIGFAVAVPAGPVWLIALVAAIEGGGFGIAWTFILRRVTKLSDPAETERVSGALPTVQRLGYALGAAYIGIIANAAGFAEAETAEALLPAARWVFLGSLPLALVGLVAMARFVSPGVARARRTVSMGMD